MSLWYSCSDIPTPRGGNEANSKPLLIAQARLGGDGIHCSKVKGGHYSELTSTLSLSLLLFTKISCK